MHWLKKANLNKPHLEKVMNMSINQLEERLYELENLRLQRQSWLDDLLTPMTDHLQYLTELRAKTKNQKNNVIQFPLERRLSK